MKFWLAVLVVLVAIGSGCATQDASVKRLEFVFSPREWETYRERLTENSRDDFELAVSMDGSGELVRATAHLRGQTSFRCRRRSYTLNLFGQRGPVFLAGSPTDEYYLLSLCRDHGHVAQHTVLQLFRELKLFPMAFEYVELRLNGHSRGVYLLVEKLERLRLSNLDVHGLYRRRFASGRTTLEVKYSRGETASVDALSGAFEGLENLSGEALVTAFEARMDLEQYLTWLATNALLQNGDSVDELWLVLEHRPTPYLRFAGWDPDDVFRPCHYESKFAFEDPFGLAYCAEAEWDELLLSDPVGYARYVDVLEDLIEHRLSVERFDKALTHTENELAPFLSRPEIAKAMRHGDQSLLTARDAMARMSRAFRARRDELAERIAQFREAQGQGE